MAWSSWEETGAGKYQTKNLDTSSVGRNSLGLPNPPSIPSLPISNNCAYIVYGDWRIRLNNGSLSNPATTPIVLHQQVRWSGNSFYWYSTGFPVYHVGRYASFNGIVRVDNSIEYGNQDIRCAIGESYHSVYGYSNSFTYSNWHKDLNYEIIFVNISVQGLLNCDYTLPTSPAKPKLFLGTAAPPPPLPKNMNCCDCNTIATIIESQMIARDKLFENVKDHVDQRIKEEIAIHGKQLEALEMDLQPVIDRINESESNLWNGKR